jgi:hypothetical protein
MKISVLYFAMAACQSLGACQTPAPALTATRQRVASAGSLAAAVPLCLWIKGTQKLMTTRVPERQESIRATNRFQESQLQEIQCPIFS